MISASHEGSLRGNPANNGHSNLIKSYDSAQLQQQRA